MYPSSQHNKRHEIFPKLEGWISGLFWLHGWGILISLGRTQNWTTTPTTPATTTATATTTQHRLRGFRWRSLLRHEVFVTAWSVCYDMKCLVVMKCLLRHEVFVRHDRFQCCWQVLVLTHSFVHWLQEKRSKLGHCTLLSYVTSSLRVLPLNLSRLSSIGWEGSVCSHFPTPVLQLTYWNPYIYIQAHC